jgi:UPF0716 protein FxsA
MFLLPLILFIAWPVAELYVIVKVAEAIGVLETIALLIVAWPLGSWAMRSQGRVAWRRMSTAVAEGRPPAREVLDGTLILLGGALLIIPGFITDVLGLTLLLPPTRALVRAVLVRNIKNRLVIQAFAVTRPRGPHDVDSTATDIDQPRLRR